MVGSPQEIPLLAVIGLSAVGAGFLVFYRNVLCPKENANSMQTAYGITALLGSFVTIVSAIYWHNKLLFWIESLFTVFFAIYFIASFFSSTIKSSSMWVWSDFCLVVLYVFFCCIKWYAKALMIYHRIKSQKKEKNLTDLMAQQSVNPFIQRLYSVPDAGNF